MGMMVVVLMFMGMLFVPLMIVAMKVFVFMQMFEIVFEFFAGRRMFMKIFILFHTKCNNAGVRAFYPALYALLKTISNIGDAQ